MSLCKDKTGQDLETYPNALPAKGVPQFGDHPSNLMATFHFVLYACPLLEFRTAGFDILLVGALDRGDTSEALKTVLADLLVLSFVVVDQSRVNNGNLYVSEDQTYYSLVTTRSNVSPRAVCYTASH